VNPRNFFGELKRGNVYKVAIAYGIVAFTARPRLLVARMSFAIELLQSGA